MKRIRRMTLRTQLRTKFGQHIGQRPGIVFVLALLHGLILVRAIHVFWSAMSDIVIPATYYGALPLVSHYPRLGIISLIWALCFAGLWYSKPWAWLLTMLFDVIALATSSTTPILPAISFALLFHPRVQKYYAMQRWIDKVPALKNAHQVFNPVDSIFKSMQGKLEGWDWEIGVNRIMLGIVALGQVLVSVVMLCLVPLMLLYGGASGAPLVVSAFVIYPGIGLFAAYLLYSRPESGRLLALIWHLMFLGVMLLPAASTRHSEWENNLGGLLSILASAVSALYLGISIAACSRIAARQK